LEPKSNGGSTRPRVLPYRQTRVKPGSSSTKETVLNPDCTYEGTPENGLRQDSKKQHQTPIAP